jgi:hypothetical protein
MKIILAILLLCASASLSASRTPIYSCLIKAPKNPADLVLWVYTADPCTPEIAAHRDKIPNIDVRVKEGDLTLIKDLHSDMVAEHRSEIDKDPLSPWKKLDAEYSGFEHRFIDLGSGVKRRQFVADYSGNPLSLTAMGAYFECLPISAEFFPAHENKVAPGTLSKLWVSPKKGKTQIQEDELFEYCSRVKMTRQILLALLASTNRAESKAEIEEVRLYSKQWKDYLEYGRLAYPWEFWRADGGRRYMLPAPPSAELILLHPSLVFEFGDTAPATGGVLLDVVGFTRNLFWDSREMNDGLGAGNVPSMWWWGTAIVMDARASAIGVGSPIPAIGLGISIQGAVYFGDVEGGITWRPHEPVPFWFIGFEPLGLLQKIVSAV